MIKNFTPILILFFLKGDKRNLSESTAENEEQSDTQQDKESTNSKDPSEPGKSEENENETESETNQSYEYDLVGVTVHTGTADGGHYYSFIRERGVNPGQQDRWLLFNDAEVRYAKF